MELFFTIMVGLIIGFFIGRVYEFRTQYNYRAAYDKLNKELNELHRKYVKELEGKIYEY